MKKLIYFISVLILAAACTEEKYSLEDPVNIDDIRIRIYELEEDNSYMFVNGIKGSVTIPTWDLGNGQVAKGDTVYAQYAFKDNYTVKMTVFDGVKPVVVSTTVRVMQDNLEYVNDPVYLFLTGGADAQNGKTWVLDSLRTGHVRLLRTQVGNTFNDLKAPLFFSNIGVYDDEISFKLIGAECRYNNKGVSLSHGGTIDGVAQFRIEQLRQMGTVTSVRPSPVGDFLVGYTPSENPQKWAIVKRTQKVNNVDTQVYYLKLTGGAFFFFYRGNSPSDIEYRIDSISENYLRVAHLETAPASRAVSGWQDHYILVPKGYPIQPEVPDTPVPPRAENITENFENLAKSVTFTYFDALQTGWMGLPSFSVVANPREDAVNPSDSVGRFVRGIGYDEQLQIKKGYKFDLSVRNKFRMKVYFPTYNNYTGVNLKPTVEMRLRNSANAAQVQPAKTITIAQSDFGKWVEVVFDFSDQASQVNFDTWVIQFGGQYPKGTQSSPGIFFFDDLELL